MAPKSKKSEFPAFTNFTIKVAERSWERTVEKLLNSVEGVTNFVTEGDGKINISGYVEPALLLKRLRKLGKSAKVMHWQYGECSNNMYVKKKEPVTDKNVNANGSNGYCLYPGDPGYGGHGGYNGHGYPRYGNNHDYNRIEYAGNASDYNGHHTGCPGHGGYNGHGYPRYGNNCDYNHIEYAGNASDYNGHHTGYPGHGGYNGHGYPRYGNNYDYNAIECAGNASAYNGHHTGYPGYGNNYGYNRIEGAGNASDGNGHHIEKPKNPEKSASASSWLSCFNGGF